MGIYLIIVYEIFFVRQKNNIFLRGEALMFCITDKFNIGKIYVDV